jgi:hypothetical protein
MSNNSKFALDQFSIEEKPNDITPMLQQKESDLINVIEALKNVSQSKDWRSLKNRIFDGVVEKLERDLLSEAKKDSPDNLVLARLNGQLVWAKKYADLEKMADVFRIELSNVKKQLGK